MPTLIENSLTISLPDLKKQGYFDRKRSGIQEWHRFGRIQSRVAITICFDEENLEEGGTLLLRYNQNGYPVNQSIGMVHVRSNLGCGGGIWYFVCPKTGRRCRLLIDSPFGFVSRHAPSINYQSQLMSRSERKYHKSLVEIRVAQRRADLMMQWMCKPNCKRVYAGKLTRPMKRLHKLMGYTPEFLATAIQ